MQRLLLGSLFVLGLAGCQVSMGRDPTSADRPADGSRIDAELSVRKIADDAFVVTHEPFYAANVLVVRMPDGAVVLCSSPYETQATRALVRWVRETLHPSRIVAINTHFHFDGTGGNEAYRELGVTTYASDHTQALVTEKNEALKAEWAKDFDDDRRRRVEAMKIVPAEHTFPERDGLVLQFGEEQVRVVYPGAGHSLDNVVVFFPSRGILFGGCMIKASRSVGFVGHADLEHWQASVEVARGLGAKIVVPGHGGVSGPDLFDLTTAVVREARATKK